MNKIVEIKCLEHVYPDKTKIEICGIEFIVYKGEKVAVLGPSGSGKTTLLKHIIGLLTPSEGTVKVFGLDPAKDYSDLCKKIGVVLQNVEEQLIGPSVLEDVMFAPLNFGMSLQQAEKAAVNILEKLNITKLKDKIIHYLSGGEKRKVALAGALVMNPELLVLDEPFSGLDIKSEREYIKILNEISENFGISIIISTHNVELVSEFADTIYLISSSHNISQKGTPEEIFIKNREFEKFNLEAPFSVKLFEKLHKKGINTEIPLNIDSAEELLLKFYAETNSIY